MPGEVDVFKIDHTHELYGHMNVNYLQLDRIPRFDDDWPPVLDALPPRPVLRDDRRGAAAPISRVGGKPSGETLTLEPATRGPR